MATDRLKQAKDLLERYDAFEREMLARPVVADPEKAASPELQRALDAALAADELSAFAEQHAEEILGTK